MSKRILIADDDKNLRLLVRTTLEDARYEITEAGNGSDTLKAVRELHPDLVLLDWMMPGMSGIEVLREMRQDPLLVSIPVVVLTAKVQYSDRQRALDAGADTFVTKPFSPLELMEIVEEMLGP